jgi:hypothetical protein
MSGRLTTEVTEFAEKTRGIFLCDLCDLCELCGVCFFPAHGEVERDRGDLF